MKKPTKIILVSTTCIVALVLGLGIAYAKSGFMKRGTVDSSHNLSASSAKNKNTDSSTGDITPTTNGGTITKGDSSTDSTANISSKSSALENTKTNTTSKSISTTASGSSGSTTTKTSTVSSTPKLTSVPNVTYNTLTATNYVLPTTITGYMSDGSKVTLSVKWQYPQMGASSPTTLYDYGTVSGWSGKITASIVVKAPAVSSSTTNNYTKASGYDTTLRDELDDKITDYYLNTKAHASFKPYYTITNLVYETGIVQPLVDKEAVAPGSSGLGTGYTWQKDNMKYTIDKCILVRIETDQATADGIMALVEANSTIKSIDYVTVGNVSVYYDASIKKNIVEICSYDVMETQLIN